MRNFIVLLVWCFGMGQGFAEAMPEDVLAKLQKNPDGYLDHAGSLINGFGGAQGIDKAGIELALALQRADARAAALRKLMLADLDFDGSISTEEFKQVAAATAATARGKLWKMKAAADADGDGTITIAELDGFGRAEALRKVGADKEAEALSVLSFDADKNGWVDMDEVSQGVAELEPAPVN